MSVIAGTHLLREKYMSRERQHWAEGRRVAIMPDVPGKHFNPEDSIFLRTPEEQEIGKVAISTVLDKMLHDGKPSWYESELTSE